MNDSDPITNTIRFPLFLPPPSEIAYREMRRVWKHNLRAVGQRAGHGLTLAEWLDILNRHGWQCAYCGGPFESMDHVLPIGRGGGTVAGNVVPSCVACNNLRDRVDTLAQVLAELGETGRLHIVDDLLHAAGLQVGD